MFVWNGAFVRRPLVCFSRVLGKMPLHLLLFDRMPCDFHRAFKPCTITSIFYAKFSKTSGVAAVEPGGWIREFISQK